MSLNTIQTVQTNKRPLTPTDRLFWGAFLAVAILLIEATLTMGACVATETLLNAINADYLENTYIAVAAMIAVGSILLVADVTGIVVMINRLVRPVMAFEVRQNRPEQAAQASGEPRTAMMPTTMFPTMKVA